MIKWITELLTKLAQSTTGHSLAWDVRLLSNQYKAACEKIKKLESDLVIERNRREHWWRVASGEMATTNRLRKKLARSAQFARAHHKNMQKLKAQIERDREYHAKLKEFAHVVAEVKGSNSNLPAIAQKMMGRNRFPEYVQPTLDPISGRMILATPADSPALIHPTLPTPDKPIKNRAKGRGMYASNPTPPQIIDADRQAWLPTTAEDKQCTTPES